MYLHIKGRKLIKEISMINISEGSKSSTHHLTIFEPGFFVVKYPGGVLIGRTPQKFCKIVAMVLFFYF